jgi:hypothetical protein
MCAASFAGRVRIFYRAQTWPAPCDDKGGRERAGVWSLCVDVEEIAVFKGFCDDFGEPTAPGSCASGSADFAGQRALFAARACMQ